MTPPCTPPSAKRTRVCDTSIRTSRCRIVLEQDLEREYQEFLQAHNRDRPDSTGRPDRDAAEVRRWALEHELPYFNDRVHVPDYRIEYEVDGRQHREQSSSSPRTVSTTRRRAEAAFFEAHASHASAKRVQVDDRDPHSERHRAEHDSRAGPDRPSLRPAR